MKPSSDHRPGLALVAEPAARPLLFAAVLIGLAACMTLGLTSYSANALQAKIVDADTGEPLEGVNVVAHWELVGGMEGGEGMGQMMVMEAVTDRDGIFRLPAWGPLRIPVGLRQSAHMSSGAPHLLIFKHGYTYASLYSFPAGKPTGEYWPTSEWNNETIKLHTFVGGGGTSGRMLDPNSYEWMLNRFTSELTDATVSSNGDSSVEPARNECLWRHIPKMILALRQENADLEAFLIGNEERLIERGCGSPTEFLLRLAP